MVKLKLSYPAKLALLIISRLRERIMVTTEEAINAINLALDERTYLLISKKIQDTHYNVQDLEPENLVIILLNDLANSPNRLIFDTDIPVTDLNYIAQTAASIFGPRFINEIEELNEDRTYLLNQVTMLGDNREGVLQQLINIAESDDFEQIIDKLMQRYFAGSSYSSSLLRDLLEMLLKRKEIHEILANNNEVDEVLDYIKATIGGVEDNGSIMGITYRAINGVDLNHGFIPILINNN